MKIASLMKIASFFLQDCVLTTRNVPCFVLLFSVRFLKNNIFLKRHYGKGVSFGGIIPKWNLVHDSDHWDPRDDRNWDTINMESFLNEIGCESKEAEKILVQYMDLFFSLSKTGGKQIHNENATQRLAAGHARSMTVQNQVVSKTVCRFDSFTKLTLGCPRPPWISVDGVFITHSPFQLKAHTLATWPSLPHLPGKQTA